MNNPDKIIGGLNSIAFEEAWIKKTMKYLETTAMPYEERVRYERELARRGSEVGLSEI